MDKEFLFNFILENKYAVLSTISPDGLPQGAAVGIAADDNLNIVFDTLTTSRKYKNIIANQSVAFTIGLESGETMQYEGIARVPHDEQIDEVKEFYFEVFPDGIERAKQPDVAYFFVEPKWIRYCDYSLPEPLIEEISF